MGTYMVFATGHLRIRLTGIRRCGFNPVCPWPHRRTASCPSRPSDRCDDRNRRKAGFGPRAQRGSVYLSYALLALAVMLAGALLVGVDKAFALLLPIGVLVFFLPNLAGLWARFRLGREFRRRLTTALGNNFEQALVLQNELGGNEARAVWFDPSHGRLGFLSSDRDSLLENIAALRGVRAVYVGETHAISFHQGQMRIPPRYLMIFEFENGHLFELVTRKRSRMHQWVESLRPHMGDRLDTRAIDKTI